MTCTFSCSKDIVIIHISLGEGECVWRDHGEIEREKMKETSLTEIGHVFANPFLCFYNFSTCLENLFKKCQ